MKRFACVMMFVFFAVLGAAHLVEAATLDDAKALGIKAAEFVKANGKEKGAAELQNPKGQLTNGPLYVTLHDFNGVIVAFPPNPKLVGQNHLQLTDPVSGKYLNKEMIEIAKTKGGGWVEYHWANNATKKVQRKKAWVQRVEGMGLYTLCGLFQD